MTTKRSAVSDDNNRVWGFVAGIIMIMLVFATMGFVNQKGGVSMKTEYVKAVDGRTLWKDFLINGETTGTSTIYDIGSNSYFGFGYKFAWGTSTPQTRIEWYEGVGINRENIIWEPSAAGELTATTQASSDTAVATFRPAVAQWIRFRFHGLTGNATGTTFRAWLIRQ